jgi:hypothetical protein
LPWSNSPLTGSHFRLNHWPTGGFVWGETEGAATPNFIRFVALKHFSY